MITIQQDYRHWWVYPLGDQKWNEAQKMKMLPFENRSEGSPFSGLNVARVRTDKKVNLRKQTFLKRFSNQCLLNIILLVIVQGL